MSDQIVWKDEYKIGVAKIDNQHRKLFDYLERLRLFLPRGLQNPVVGSTIKDLVDYTQFHFKEEEKFMRQIDFVDLEKHSELHKDLLKELADILRRLKRDDNYTGLDLMAFLRHWIVDHVIREDVRIGKAYEEATSSPTSS
ncbi:MAG: hemerythrin family protein [bacterium]|nr:hemerythrin family protein [bacterium]